MKKLLILSTFLLGSLFANAIPKDSMVAYIDSLVEEIEKVRYSSYKQSEILLNEIYSIVKKDTANEVLFTRYLYAKVSINYAHNIQDHALIFTIQNARQQIDKNHYPFEYALLTLCLTSVYAANNHYTDAFSMALEGIELFEQLDNKEYVARLYSFLGRLCLYMKLFDMAKDYFDKALALMSPNTIDYYRTYLSRNWEREYVADSTVWKAETDSLLLFLSKVRDFGDPALLFRTYLFVADFYFMRSQYENARRYLLIAEEMQDEVDNTKIVFLLYDYWGIYHYLRKEYQKALQCEEKCLQIAEVDNDEHFLFNTYLNMSSIYDAMGNVDKAYAYLKKARVLNDKLFGSKLATSIYKAYIGMTMEASNQKLVIAEQKVALQEQKVALQKENIITIITVSIIVILLILLLLRRMQHQKRTKIIENRELALRLEKEKEIQQLHDEKHAEDMAFKMREITSTTLQLSYKNDVLQQILTQVQQLPKDKKETNDVRKNIEQTVKKNLNADNDWETFKLHFDKVHPSFFERLKIHCSDLTETNLRLCAFCRIGLPNKQISQILNISPESVITHRYRLRKKLELSEDTNLEDFLRNV